MFGESVKIPLFVCLVLSSINANAELEKSGIAKRDISIENDSKNRDTLPGFVSNEPYSKRIVSQMNSNEVEFFLDYFQDREREKQTESKMGFGGSVHPRDKGMVVRKLTTSVNKVINHVKAELEENARIIRANNPPQVIDKIPHTPIIFKLRHIEGASSLATSGTSWGAHYYEETFVMAQFKFDEIRYHYDVLIRRFNLFAIPITSLTVILGDAWTVMGSSTIKNKSTIPRFEFLHPRVVVNFGTHRWINYALNQLIDEGYPRMKRQLVEIASKDTFVLLNNRLKNAQ